MTGPAVPKHDHPILAYAAIFIAVVMSLLVGTLAYTALRPALKSGLRCSAFVTPPRDCKP